MRFTSVFVAIISITAMAKAVVVSSVTVRSPGAPQAVNFCCKQDVGASALPGLLGLNILDILALLNGLILGSEVGIGCEIYRGGICVGTVLRCTNPFPGPNVQGIQINCVRVTGLKKRDDSLEPPVPIPIPIIPGPPIPSPPANPGPHPHPHPVPAIPREEASESN